MNQCMSRDVLLDLILTEGEARFEPDSHVAACATCTEELGALRPIVDSLLYAQAEPMPEAWMRNIMVSVYEESRSGKAVSLPGLFADSLPTLGLASVTVLACVAVLAPELGHPIGLLTYSLSAGALAAAWEVRQSLKDDDLTSA